jgi:DNA polymerase II large subunit
MVPGTKIPTKNTKDDDYLNDVISKYLDIAENARSKGIDPSNQIESKILTDFRNRFQESIKINNISDFLNEIQENSISNVFSILRNFVKGKYGFYVETEETINKALRLAIVVLTNGCDIKATNFIHVIIKEDERKNKYFEVKINDSYKFISAYKIFISLLLVEEIRKAYNYERKPDQKALEALDILQKGVYLSNSLLYNETKTHLIKYIVEKLSFIISFKNNKTDVNKEPTSSVYYLRNLIKFINKVFINRIQENIAIIERLKLDSWSWLKDLIIYNDNNQNDSRYNVVLCNPSEGGFQLRVGEAQNTFGNFVGVHPSIFEIFSDFMYEGCNAIIKIRKNKLSACKLVSVNSLTPPLVKLSSGSTKRLDNVAVAHQIKQKIEKILSFGDILIPMRVLPINIRKDVTESCNDQLWLNEMFQKIHMNATSESVKIINSIAELTDNGLFFNPKIKEIVDISRQLSIPLHSIANLEWSKINAKELDTLYEQVVTPLFSNERIIALNLSSLLDKLGIEYEFTNKGLVVSEEHAYLLSQLLKKKPDTNENKSIYVLLKEISGIEIVPKIYVGLSIPQKVKIKKSENEFHGILPAIKTDTSGKHYDIISFCKSAKKITSVIYFCDVCSKYIPYSKCPLCNSQAKEAFYCEQCGKINKYNICSVCSNTTKSTGPVEYNWDELLVKASSNAHTQPYAPLIGLNNETEFESVERLEKAILRQKHNIKASIDGVTKFYINNLPLKFFKPNQISVNKDTLLKLGYQEDIFGNKLQSNDQILPIKPQDVIISYKLADQLRRVADFIDETLRSLYQQEPFFQIKSIDDLIGHLIVGIPQGNECGIVGRIIGFTQLDVCFSSTQWSTFTKGINQNNEYAIMLLLDVLLNFSKKFLTSEGTIYMNPFYLQFRTTPISIKDANASLNTSYLNTIKKICNERKINLTTEGFKIFYSEHVDMLSLWSETSDSIQIPRSKAEKSLVNLAQIQLSLVNKTINLTNDIIINMIEDYLIPFLTKQMREFGTKYRCQYCNKTYRRPPMNGICIVCNKQVKPTVSLDAIEAIHNFITVLSESISINQKSHEQLTIIKENISILKYGRKQITLLDY